VENLQPDGEKSIVRLEKIAINYQNMKPKLTIILAIAAAIILICVSATVLYFAWNSIKNSTPLTEKDAVTAIQNKYQELKGYPSDSFSLRSIVTEKADDGWYVAFITNGSGVPIIKAQCFLITNNYSMTQKEYNPQEQLLNGEFSAKDCRPLGTPRSGDSCVVENCHDYSKISCGANKANMCTMMYQLGDRCLQYAKCGVQNGKCQQVENAQFNQCKSCVANCLAANKNDSPAAFECESKCI
jgi:hypothetical protein